MVRNNFYRKVYLLRSGNSTGTCFGLYIDEEEYFVTAKHVVEHLGSEGRVFLFHDGGWKYADAKIYHHQNPKIDISILKLHKRVIPNPLDVNYTLGDIAHGQDTYFLGFPYQIFSNAAKHINADYPMPFAKKGICSLITHQNKITTVYLDGHNNPGFSGGPVCFKNFKTNELHIGAVISAYRLNHPQAIIDKNNEEQELYYRENAGIIISYDIKHAFEIINEQAT